VEADAKKVRRGLRRQGTGRRLTPEQEAKKLSFAPEQRLLVLDVWKRSGLPAGDLASLIGLSRHTLYDWKCKFEKWGAEGLLDQPRGGPRGSRLPEATKRAILMLKEAHDSYGCQRISDLLARGAGLAASAGAVAKVLHDAGYVLVEEPTRPHGQEPKEFERAGQNQMWQTDIFTFILRRQNRRVYLIAFMDDHSRFIVSYGVHSCPSTALVLEVFRAGISSFQAPEEVLTDNGPQYATWRGKSAFSKECDKLGIKQILASPRHPETLGKIERYWRTLYEDLIKDAVFLDLEDARHRIGLFIDHYNFQRPHQGIGGATPADRYFGAAPQVLESVKRRVKENAVEIAKHGVPKKPFYLAGQLGGKPFCLHAEGERMYLVQEDGRREEVKLLTPHAQATAAMDASMSEDEKRDLEVETMCPDGSLPDAACVDHVPGPQDQHLETGLRQIAETMPQEGQA
jgi:transposase InsO family protein